MNYTIAMSLTGCSNFRKYDGCALQYTCNKIHALQVHKCAKFSYRLKFLFKNSTFISELWYLLKIFFCISFSLSHLQPHQIQPKKFNACLYCAREHIIMITVLKQNVLHYHNYVSLGNYENSNCLNYLINGSSFKTTETIM